MTSVAETRLVLRGRGIVPGRVAGRALVSHETISGWGGIEPATGTIIERRHELYGVCFTGKVLVFPGAKGSSGWSGFFQSTRLMGTAPLAMVFTNLTTKAALGAIVTRVPTVTKFDDDPVAKITTGDRVEVDADNGLVIVYGPRPGHPR
ncbi:aconitase X swivel domain-containing protein [Streptomyces asiaticus]|uniref:aconitase X swivel domain-containing protein n=1 Tax=Streptomyces asiaticus TaxID=114695 RepID=UPI0038138AFC